jgi:hypothetical protein
VTAGAAYALLALALTWPLPRHLGTHLPGDPQGDLGVYVWNLWIFRHELVRHARAPVSTEHIFGYTSGVDFSVHNYTPIAGLAASPLVERLGIVATFNVLLLAFIAASGAATYLLARRLGTGRLAAWLAGALFMSSPVLVARHAEHFSLVQAAPLPLFLWALVRAVEARRTRDAVLVGVFVGLATYSDAYYGIFCALMGAFVVAWRFTCPEYLRQGDPPFWLARTLDVILLLAAGAIVWRAVAGPSGFAAGPVRISVRTIYTPMLIALLAGGWRVWLWRRPILRWHDPERQLPRLLHLGLIAIATCLLVLLPTLIGLTLRLADGRLPETETLWRSSPRGVDALSYLVPNPNHAVFGDETRRWFAGPPEAFPELIGSFSIVALALIGVVAMSRGLPSLWVGFTLFFVLLSWGPFVHVAGVNTHVIGPWALLRYVPLVSFVRSPSRLAIVAVLGFSLLSAFAFEWLRARTRTPQWITVVLTGALAFELAPLPRPLFSAAVPDVYRLIVAEGVPQERGRLLELPTGIRDGTWATGNFRASAQYYQTSHRRPIVGGYVSRVSNWRRSENERTPMLRTLYALSERRMVTPGAIDEARRSRDAFLRRSCVAYVLVDKRQASDELQAFAENAMGLMLVHEDSTYVLYSPADPPPCDPPQRRRRWTS